MEAMIHGFRFFDLYSIYVKLSRNICRKVTFLEKDNGIKISFGCRTIRLRNNALYEEGKNCAIL